MDDPRLVETGIGMRILSAGDPDYARGFLDGFLGQMSPIDPSDSYRLGRRVGATIADA